MRKILGLICLLLLVAEVGFAFESTPSYSFRSTSAYAVTTAQKSYSPHSAQAISAANYAALNAPVEEETYSPARSIRTGRPGSGGTGNIVWESPIGDIPWLLFALAAMAYVVIKKHKSRAVN